MRRTGQGKKGGMEYNVRIGKDETWKEMEGRITDLEKYKMTIKLKKTIRTRKQRKGEGRRT